MQPVPSSCAQALVPARRTRAAPAPLVDRRTEGRTARLERIDEWLLHPFGDPQDKLAAVGGPLALAPGPAGEPRLRSGTARERTVDAVVAKALARDAARRKGLAAKRAATRTAGTGLVPGKGRNRRTRPLPYSGLPQSRPIRNLMLNWIA